MTLSSSDLLRGSCIDFYVEDSHHRERLVFSCPEIFLSAGEVLHIVGSNGAGKTSLLRILVGLLDSASGTSSGEVEFASDKILYIGHSDGLSSSLTVWEHLRLWHELGGCVVDDLELFARDWFVEDLFHVRVSDCSAGECRKLSLLRLFLSSTDIWFLDEPFSSLDIGVRDRFLVGFGAHCASGGGIIMTGHGDNFSGIGLNLRLFAMG